MVSSAISFMKLLPVIRTWRNRRQYAHFLSDKGLHSHYGVFNSFAHAREKLPSSRGFDQRELANTYANIKMHRLYPYDYPVIYWLSRAFFEGSTSVFDIGGSVGVHYHAYRRILAYPVDVKWQVSELPAIVQVGRDIAARLGISELSFTDSLQMKQVQADVWISSGALQYIEDARPRRLLADCLKRPAHIILNKIPAYDGEEFIVAQNAGRGAYVPSIVYNRSRLINEIESMNYRLVDSWEVPNRNFYLPSHPEKTFDAFSGMYFKKAALL